ncbi:MAG: hypothetical protein IJ468_00610 [Lachnospiraceae bacterium]|nr:hypothetical protein [Lachnospiraceae bacterium]
MFRLWGKLFLDNHLLKDYVVENPDPQETRTHKVFAALDELAHQFDLPVPIWLDSNIRDFKRNAKTRFRQDSFMEPIEFDFLEIQIIEED